VPKHHKIDDKKASIAASSHKSSSPGRLSKIAREKTANHKGKGKGKIESAIVVLSI
jgi:hypothetical protein